MAVHNIEAKCWILALFVRDDNERLLLGDGNYNFTAEQQHFAANEMSNDTVEVQGNDGILLAGQVRRAATQSFDGYIGDSATNGAETETLRRNFIGFFAKDHFFSVIYIFEDGSAIKRQRGFIVDAPEVQELRWQSPSYHVALNFEDVNYYEYAENSEGEEVYSGSVEVHKIASNVGGLVWDEVGVVWDTVGAEWEEGGGEVVSVYIDATAGTYPVWTVEGVAVNPQLENVDSETAIIYNGTIAEGQTLVVDMFNQQAKLNGLDVTANLSGDWVFLLPGYNRLAFTTSSGATKTSKLEWNEVVG